MEPSAAQKTIGETEQPLKRFVVILANGAFPQKENALSYLRKADRLVCCDGATNKAIAHGLTPDFIVGDLDSLSPELKERFSDRIVHIAEQESNDLSKSFAFCLSKGWKNIVILGASGEREDHLRQRRYLRRHQKGLRHPLQRKRRPRHRQKRPRRKGDQLQE